MSALLLDAAGRRRSPATLPHFHAGRPPRNKGIRYPADPPTVEEIIAVMRTAGDAARAHQPRHHVYLSARHRQRRDHRHRARTPRPDDPRPQLPARLTERDRRQNSHGLLAAGRRPTR
jgi:hypothetical protein